MIPQRITQITDCRSSGNKVHMLHMFKSEIIQILQSHSKQYDVRVIVLKKINKFQNGRHRLITDHPRFPLPQNKTSTTQPICGFLDPPLAPNVLWTKL